MHKRTLAGALGVDNAAGPGRAWLLGHELCCARACRHRTPTRTPRPTWTPASGGFQVATPTIDATRFPAAALTSQARRQAGSTPQVFVPGGNGPIFVPVRPGGGAVQTVVVVIVTATPPPTPDVHARPADLAAPANLHARPANGDADKTGTPLPPVTMKVKVDKSNVRQGRALYPVVTAWTWAQRHCGGPQSRRRLVEDLLRQRPGCLDRRFGGGSHGADLGGARGDQYPAAAADTPSHRRRP